MVGWTGHGVVHCGLVWQGTKPPPAPRLDPQDFAKRLVIEDPAGFDRFDVTFTQQRLKTVDEVTAADTASVAVLLSNQFSTQTTDVHNLLQSRDGPTLEDSTLS